MDLEVAPDGSPVAVYRSVPVEPALSILRSALPPGASVLDLGCGPGRFSSPLVAAGHPVVAVDESPAMLAHVSGAETVQADVWRLELGRRFGAVLATAHLFDQPDAERKRSLLAVCRRHLDDAGVVVIERYPPDWEPAEASGTLGPVSVSLHDVEGDRRRFSAAVTYTVGGRGWTQRFTSSVTPDDELEELARRAGLRVDGRLDERGSWVRLVAS